MNVEVPIYSRAEIEPAERGFNLREYVNFLWRQWPFILTITVLSLVVAGVDLARTPPLFTATAQVLLDPQQPKVPGMEAVQSDLGIDDSVAIENQIAIIKSDSLLKRVVTNEGLAPPAVPLKVAQPSVWSVEYIRSLMTGGAKAEAPKPAEAQPSDEDRAIQAGVNALRSSVMVSRSGQGYVLSIAATQPSPAKAAKVANAVADAFVLDKLDTRYEAAKRASTWLGDRLTELRQQLHDSEEAVALFRSENGLVRTGATATFSEEQLGDLNNKVLAARTDTAEKRTRVEFLSDVIAGKKSIAELPDSFLSGIQSTMMGSLRQKLADLSQQEADLLSRYDSRHPAVVNLQAEKRDLEQAIQAETERTISTVKADYALAQARQAAAEQALRGATGSGGLDSQAAIKLRELERTAAVNKTLFEDFLQKAKISEQVTTAEARDVRILTPAQPPGGQSSPQVTRVLTVALIIGLGLGIACATALELLHVGFTTPREVEDKLHLPVLVTIAQLSPRKRMSGRSVVPVPLLQVHKPLSRFSESIRTLRSGIQMTDVDRPPKLIQITSSKPDEGKTTLSLSLAISSAASGVKTLIIDGDLRHSSASHFFKLTKTPGVVDVLLGEIALDDAIRLDDGTGVYVLPAGAPSLNPPDILGSEKMAGLVTALKARFDYIVIDTPPMGPVVDATIIARLVDKTIFVVRWGSTPRELVETLVRRLSTRGRIAGVVLNGVDEGRAKKYGRAYYYGSPYYNKYYVH